MSRTFAMVQKCLLHSRIPGAQWPPSLWNGRTNQESSQSAVWPNWTIRGKRFWRSNVTKNPMMILAELQRSCVQVEGSSRRSTITAEPIRALWQRPDRCFSSANNKTKTGIKASGLNSSIVFGTLGHCLCNTLVNNKRYTIIMVGLSLISVTSKQANTAKLIG